MHIFVSPCKLVVLISGGMQQSVQQGGKSLTIDGSQSYDEDKSLSQRFSSLFEFQR